MALLHFDGFDLGDYPTIYSLSSATFAATSTSTRFGSGSAFALRSGGVATLTFPASSTTYVGFAYSAPVSANAAVLSAYGDNNVTEHLRLWWSSSTTLAVGRAATVLATAAVNEPVDSWVYLEVMVTVADTGGRVVVKVDGATVIDFTGDTKNAGTATTIDTIRMTTGTGSLPRLFDDLYVCDGTGAAPHNTFLGPVRVYTLSPTGAGTDTAMTPSAGANWQCVDEQPYSATDYVTGSTGQRDTYALADLPASPGTIFAVQPTTVAAKTDAGALSLKTAIRSGGTVYTGTAAALGSTDTSVRTIRTTNPATSAAWTKANVDALEAGAEVA
ncbi:hypothetical protein [Terrabacter sp. C0L_2]|uniref:hypothetical protein n=1 Tax=Terrabacter sp. C0L_2 TaxID=3108389 RepID=UPI002ED04CB9|nr:hypothetical protein U5C87_17845 [Terrabacter sp. C0L_2]